MRELNTTQINALDRTKTVVILPGGILEEHGPYLPAYSDGYQTEFVADRPPQAIAARPGWTVLKFPPMPLGAAPASDIGAKSVFAGSYPVRMSTLRAVYVDRASDLGEAGFKWVFVLNPHGAPTHNRALDDAGRFFADTCGGRMVSLCGLAEVAGAAPPGLFTTDQKRAEGFSVHADADEHSRVLFLRPDLVAPSVGTAPPIVGRSLTDLVTIAGRDDWPGYWGTPAIATVEAGRRRMSGIADAAVRVAQQVLDGRDDAAWPRVAAATNDLVLAPILGSSLAREREIERRQTEWLLKQRP